MTHINSGRFLFSADNHDSVSFSLYSFVQENLRSEEPMLSTRRLLNPLTWGCALLPLPFWREVLELVTIWMIDFSKFSVYRAFCTSVEEI